MAEVLEATLGKGHFERLSDQVASRASATSVLFLKYPSQNPEFLFRYSAEKESLYLTEPHQQPIFRCDGNTDVVLSAHRRFSRNKGAASGSAFRKAKKSMQR
ncbi:MAG: hypothetical protein AAF717_19960 [Bacteroidota bacterium]